MSIPPVLTVTLNPAIDLLLAIEAWPREDMARATEARRAAGGKGVNVSRMLAELGVASEAFCLVGDTPDTDVFLSLLAGLPIIVSTHAVAGALRTNVTVTCAADKRRLKVNQSGPAVNARTWREVESAIEALLPGRQWLALSGALPAGAPPKAYARLVKLGHKHGARVALDCAGAALLDALKEKPDLVKPNREELEETLGTPCRSRKAVVAGVRELQRRGASRVIVSGGGADCLGFDGAQTWLARPPKIKVDNPMGGGDSLLAGFLAGDVAGEPFERALNLGLASGAATAMMPNTVFGKKTDVLKLRKQVSVEAL
jgi:1-phosphofructokinase